MSRVLSLRTFENKIQFTEFNGLFKVIDPNIFVTYTLFNNQFDN